MFICDMNIYTSVRYDDSIKISINDSIFRSFYINYSYYYVLKGYPILYNMILFVDIRNFGSNHTQLFNLFSMLCFCSAIYLITTFKMSNLDISNRLVQVKWF